MKRLLLSMTLALFTFALSAQMTTKKADKVAGTVPPGNDTEEAVYNDYERIIESAFKVNFRSYAFSKLDLTENQIEKLTPLYLEYFERKSELMERRNELVMEYQEEMKEDDTLADEEEETGDFIENYWEVDIAELELKKDYFDRFEDIISYRKALDFFRLEEQVSNRIKEDAITQVIPVLVMRPVYKFQVNPEVEKYNKWMLDVDGKVDLGHEYTHDALTQLVNTVEALATEADVNIENFEEHKKTVMMLADDNTENWKSTDHADNTRKAFITVATMFGEIAEQSPFMAASTKNIANELMTAAKKIKTDKLMTDQADHIYNFFEKAQRTVNTLAKTADLNWEGEWMEARR